MGIRLQKAIFHNRAPFEHLELDFQDSNISVLSGINGRGKTTILSHIVDAFYEMAKKGFHNEFENKANKFYRVSSPYLNFSQSKASFVYFRFDIDGTIIDYLDVRNICTETEYNEAIKIDNKIMFSAFENNLKRTRCVKHVSILDEISEKIFSNKVNQKQPHEMFIFFVVH